MIFKTIIICAITIAIGAFMLWFERKKKDFPFYQNINSADHTEAPEKEKTKPINEDRHNAATQGFHEHANREPYKENTVTQQFEDIIALSDILEENDINFAKYSKGIAPEKLSEWEGANNAVLQYCRKGTRIFYCWLMGSDMERKLFIRWEKCSYWMLQRSLKGIFI